MLRLPAPRNCACILQSIVDIAVVLTSNILFAIFYGDRRTPAHRLVPSPSSPGNVISWIFSHCCVIDRLIWPST